MKLWKQFTLSLALIGFSLSAAPIRPGEWGVQDMATGRVEKSADALKLTSNDGKYGVRVFGPEIATEPGKIYRLTVQAVGKGTLEAGLYLYGEHKKYAGRVPDPLKKHLIDTASAQSVVFYLRVSDAPPPQTVRFCLRVAAGELSVTGVNYEPTPAIPEEKVVNHLPTEPQMEGEELPIYTSPNLAGDLLQNPSLWHVRGGAMTMTGGEMQLTLPAAQPHGRILAISPAIAVEPGKEYLLTWLYQSQTIKFGTLGEVRVIPEQQLQRELERLDDALVFSSFSGRELYNRRPGHWQRDAVAFTPGADVRSVRLLLVQSGPPCTVTWSALYFGLGPWKQDNRKANYDYAKWLNKLDPPVSQEALTQILDARESVTAELNFANGRSSILVNRKKKPPLLYFGDAFDPSRSKMQDFQAAGITLQIVSLMRQDQFWRGKEEYNFPAIDATITDALQRNPHANLIVLLSVTPYTGWGDEFPAEVAMDHTGKPAVSRHGRIAPPCYWSDEYRRQAIAYIRAAVAHMKRQPYFKAVAGFFITGNEDGQFYYQVFRNGLIEDGLSPAVLPAFRRWLSAKYPSDEALQRAWNRTDVTRGTACPPSLPTRPASNFFDPSRDQAYIDLTRFLNESMGAFADEMNRTAKETAAKPILSVMWWGRGGEQFPYPLYSEASHNSPASPVNLMGGQPGYRGERNNGNSGYYPWITDSARLNGKMPVIELDFRTWTSIRSNLLTDVRNVYYWNEYDFTGALKRELGKMLSVGGGAWFYDMTAGWFKDPKILAAITRARRIAEHLDANTDDVFAPSELVFVVDEDNVYNTTEQLGCWNGPNFHTVRKNQRAMLRAGLKFDFLYLSDLMKRSMTGYKTYVFLNAFRLTPEKRAFLESLKNRNRTLVWIYAPGYLTDAGASDESISNLTGIQTKLRRNPSKQAVFAASALTQSMEGQLVGVDNSLGGESFRIDDADARTLMTYTSDQAVAGAVKRFPGYTSIYLAVPVAFTPEFLQRIAAASGIHCYNTPGDLFMHRRSDLIVLHGIEGNENRLRLPSPAATLTDLWSGERLVAKEGEYRIKLQPGETRLLEIRQAESN